MKHFILTHSWFVYEYILKYLGVYPLQRIGDHGLKATKSCQFWLRYWIFWLVTDLLNFGTNFYFQFVVSDPYQVQDAMGKIMLTSVTNTIASVGAIILNAFLHLTTIISVKQMGSDLVDVQEFCNEYMEFDQESLKRYMKKNKILLGLYMLAFLFTMFAGCGIWYQVLSLIDDLEMKSFWVVILTLTQVIFQTFLMAPLFFIIFAYGEVTSLMIAWCDQIVKLDNISYIAEQSYHLAKGLLLTEKAFSRSLFWITSIMLTSLIAWVFSTINFLKSIQFSTASWDHLLFTFGALVGCLCTAFILFYLCRTSEFLHCKVQEVNAKVTEFNIVNSEVQLVSRCLENFQGFNADGYFTVNNSLITGMVANFVTYSVILIQFGQSESSTLECECNSTTIV